MHLTRAGQYTQRWWPRAVVEVEQRWRDRLGPGLPLAANFLRVVDSDPVRIRDLPGLTGIPKEGSAMATGYLQRRGLAVAMPERSVALTANGLDVRAAYFRRASRSQQADLQDALVAVLAQSAALSAGLVPPQGVWCGERPYLAQTQRVLADPTGALPWHPMVLHRGGWPDGS